MIWNECTVRLTIIPMIAILLLLACSSSSTPAPVATSAELPTPEGFISHIDEENRFSIAVPATWEINPEWITGCEFAAAFIPENPGTPGPTMQVINRPWDKALNTLNDRIEAFRLELETSLTDFQLHSIEETFICGQEAVIMDYEGVDPTFAARGSTTSFRLLAALVKDNDTAWTASCLSIVDVFDQYESDFRQVIQSFQVPPCE